MTREKLLKMIIILVVLSTLMGFGVYFLVWKNDRMIKQTKEAFLPLCVIDTKSS